MGSAYGTTEKTGMAFKARSQASRPATSGNKNLQSSRRAVGSAHGKVSGTLKGNLKGPYNAK